MEISFAETKAIADTLPIGLYAKRRIPTSMSDSEKTSYYNPITDEIVISYPIIAEGLKKITDESYRETAIRSMEYHEVSHAILTPDTLSMTDWMNIFEDERIESILESYYLDVDFKKQVLLINGYETLTDIKAPRSALESYYQIVRFSIGKKEYIDEATSIIKKYSNLTKNSDRWDSYQYYWTVKEFYDKIVNDFTANPPASTNGDGSNSNDGDGDKCASIDRIEKTKSADSNSANKADKTNIGENTDTAMNNSNNGSKEEEQDTVNSHSRDIGLTDSEISDLVSSVFNKNPYIDNALTQKMEVIIDNFSKRNNSGSAMSAYSGVLNPRSVGTRNDYKFWDKKTSINGTNHFGSLHLNLFIDKSGSFAGSEVPMNKLLRALTEIESKNENFTLDVVFCGMGEKIVKDKRSRVFKADGGNKLDSKVYGIYRKLQKPNTFNYNIACFDGDACSDGGRSDHGFGAFDHNNCTIISDTDNKRYIDADVHSAKVIYTENYADELIDNVVAILSKAFR